MKRRFDKYEQKIIFSMEGLSKYQAAELARIMVNFSFQDLNNLSKAMLLLKEGTNDEKKS